MTFALHPNWQFSSTTTIKGPPFAVFYPPSFLTFSLYSIPFSLCALFLPVPAAPSIAPQLSIVRLFFFFLNSAAAYVLSLTLLPLIYSSLLSCFHVHCAVCFQAPWAAAGEATSGLVPVSSLWILFLFFRILSLSFSY